MFTGYLAAVEQNSGATMAGAWNSLVAVGGLETAVQVWAALYQARWITFTDDDGRRVDFGKTPDFMRTRYQVTPLFNTDYTRLGGAIEEATKINS